MKNLLIICCSLCILWGCADQGVNPPIIADYSNLDASINGKQLMCSVDSRFSLELQVLADAGYQWDCSISEPSVIQLDSVSLRVISPDLEGSPVYETFHFRAKAGGSCSVRLIQHQAYLPDVPPRETVSFLLFVQG